MIWFESIEHGCVRSLKSQSYKQIPSQLRKEGVEVGIRGS